MEEELNRHTEQKVIEKLRLLDPQQIPEVYDFIDVLVEKRRKKRELISPEAMNQKDPIQALRGRGKGEQLVERLLRSRRDDRHRDERKRSDIRT
jgi:hypothetical protein